MFSVERSNPTTEISVYLILLIGHNRAASENKKYAGTQLSKTVRENEKKKNERHPRYKYERSVIRQACSIR